MPKSQKKPRAAAPIFKLDLGLDLGLDFDVSDFDTEDEKRPRGKRQRDARILRPRTINHDAPFSKFKRIEGKEAWELCRQQEG